MPNPVAASGPGRPAGRARTLLLVAGLVVTLEAAALLALAVAELVALDAGRAGLGISTAVFLGGFATLLLIAVQRILAGQSWARGLLVFVQLLCLLLSYTFRADVWWVPLTLAAAALVGLSCLLARPVTRALSDDEPV